MKFLIDNWMLISVAAVSGGMLLWPVLRGASSGGGLDAANVVHLINREKAVVVDLGEPAEFAAGHVVGARNLPFDQFEAKLSEVARNKALPLILVCPTGSRARRALAVAQKLGYEKAQVLAGGMNAWKAANLPVEKA